MLLNLAIKLGKLEQQASSALPLSNAKQHTSHSLSFFLEKQCQLWAQHHAHDVGASMMLGQAITSLHDGGVCLCVTSV